MIDEWLNTFRARWIAKDTDGVLDLFTDDVEYWETPYKKIDNKEKLLQEWSVILKQENIELGLEVFSSAGDSHSVLWNLSYENEDPESQNWAGTYLIKLNSAGKCTYFHQTGEAK